MASHPPGNRESQSRPRMRGMRGHGPMGSVRIEKAHDPRGALRRLVAYLQPFKLPLILTAFLLLASSVLGLMGPVLLGRAIDQFGDPAALLRTISLMLGAYLGSWLSQVAQGYIMSTIAQRALRDVRRDLFEHLQTLSLSFFDRRPHGELMSRITNDVDAINRALSQNATQLVTGLLSVVGILVAMLALNPWMALASLTIFPLMVLLTLVIAKRTRAGYRRLQNSLGELNALMEETLSGQRVVMAFAQEDATVADFDRANITVRDAGIEAMVYPLLIPPMMSVLSNVVIAVVAGLGGWLAIRGLATVGTIATFITYSRRFAHPLRQLADLYNSIQAALAGAERVFAIIDEEPELRDAPDAPVLEDIVGEVIFDDVDFSYIPGTQVLNDVSLNANPGQTIALVGPTGAGKTTMVNLLTRFYDIQDGAIRIDGKDIREVQKKSLRRQLGIVLQDTFLFSTTVMENIRYGRLDATDEECIEAAKLANADQFIQRLPQGYQTELSERGSNLSQGQRQLLAIARAVLTDPGILVLDEATSSVDTRTEVRIQEALLRLMEGRTSFVIAHRLSTIRNADKVLVINGGRIIERGTHEELLEQRGFYHNLYMSQFKGNVA
jgi:ATP-binding cassette subfamily B multidrug efflux pump